MRGLVPWRKGKGDLYGVRQVSDSDVITDFAPVTAEWMRVGWRQTLLQLRGTPWGDVQALVPRLCPLSRAAAVSYHRLGFKQEKFILSQIWRPDVWNQDVSSAILSPKVLKRECCLPLPASGNSRQSLACGHITPHLVSVFLWPLLSVFSAVSSKDTYPWA